MSMSTTPLAPLTAPTPRWSGVPERLERKGRRQAPGQRGRPPSAGFWTSPRDPSPASSGGAKIDTKVDTVRNLLPKLDLLILGGGMANTFLAAEGYDLADSLVEKERLEIAREILQTRQPSRTSGCCCRKTWW